MKMAGSTAMLTGAESALGSAILSELLARGVGKVYADTCRDGDWTWPADDTARLVPVDLSVHPQRLARGMTDVEWIVNCTACGSSGLPALDTAHRPAPGHRMPTLEDTVKLTDEFAEVLSGNGGGTVVVALCELHSDEMTACTPPRRTNPGAESLLLDRLARQLAARRIQLVVFFAHLVVGCGDRHFEDQRALAAPIARRLLDQLDAVRDREPARA